MRLWLFGILALALAGPASAAPAPGLSSAEAAALRSVVERGALIYAYDQAAWHGTDDLRAKMPDFASKVGGWIVDGPAEAAEIVFFDRDEADPKGVYVAQFQGRRLVSSRILGPADDRSLSAARKALIAARKEATRALIASGATLCKDSQLNTVILSPAAPGQPILVYFLTPQTAADAVPMGGHYRVEVLPDGQAGKVRAFSNSCLELPTARADEKTAALVVTHLLDPMPTEIHVFASLAAGLPLFVGTSHNERLWEVDGASAQLVKEGD